MKEKVLIQKDYDIFYLKLKVIDILRLVFKLNISFQKIFA
jgi:hypothetical protein